MDIELVAGDARAIIDPNGAWVTNLSDVNGDVLYPKRSFKQADGSIKARGGSHVCLPNFGPGGDSGLEQHGFGRRSVWNVDNQTDVLGELSMAGSGAYAGLQATIIYQLAERSFKMTLRTTNTSDGRLRIAPAFHPYFMVPHDASLVVLDGEQLELDQLGEMSLRPGDSHVLETGARTLQLKSRGLPQWAVWTDQMGAYVCIEPTMAGNAFLQPPADDQLVAPGKTTEYYAVVEW